jgi:hypothetical protein
MTIAPPGIITAPSTVATPTTTLPVPTGTCVDEESFEDEVNERPAKAARYPFSIVAMTRR